MRECNLSNFYFCGAAGDVDRTAELKIGARAAFAAMSELGDGRPEWIKPMLRHATTLSSRGRFMITLPSQSAPNTIWHSNDVARRKLSVS